MFLKIIGLMFIIFSASLIGFNLSGKLEERLKDIRNLRQCLQILEKEIVYLSNSIPDALLSAAKFDNRISKMFLDCSSILKERQGYCISEAWNMSLEQNSKNTFLDNQDISILLSLGGNLGSYDMENQTSSIKLADSQLSFQEKYVEELLSKNGKIYKNLGVLGGIAICIMLA